MCPLDTLCLQYFIYLISNVMLILSLQYTIYLINNVMLILYEDEIIMSFCLLLTLFFKIYQRQPWSLQVWFGLIWSSLDWQDHGEIIIVYSCVLSYSAKAERLLFTLKK